MRQPTVIASLILFLSFPFPVFAQNRKLVNSGCRQGVCWETYILSKKAIRQDQLGGKKRIVYQVDIEQKRARSTERRQDWVQCSTKQPFVAFTLSGPDVNPNQVIIHYINPGGGTYGYNTPSHLMYWAVCHNIWQGNLTNLAEKARALGYSLRLKSEQQEVPKTEFRP